MTLFDEARLEQVEVKVLLAEDQEPMRTLLASSLREAGYDVVEVGDGATLCRELQEGLRDEDNPREFDLVISDVRMPGFSGLAALQLLRETGRTVPVILMTAFGDQATHDEGYRLGAARVFDKPLDVAALVREVKRLVAPG